MILNTKKRDIRSRLVPLMLSAGIILVDQVSKIVVIHAIPKGGAVQRHRRFLPAHPRAEPRHRLQHRPRHPGGNAPAAVHAPAAVVIAAALPLLHLHARPAHAVPEVVLRRAGRRRAGQLRGPDLPPRRRRGFPRFPVLRHPGHGAVADVQPRGRHGRGRRASSSSSRSSSRRRNPQETPRELELQDGPLLPRAPRCSTSS